MVDERCASEVATKQLPFRRELLVLRDIAAELYGAHGDGQM